MDSKTLSIGWGAAMLAVLGIWGLPVAMAGEGPSEAVVRAKWGEEIAKLTALNAGVKWNEEAILLVGSSSIRLWEDLAADLAPYESIRRGYGGAKYADLAVFAEELISPHAYRALVLFAANDVSGREEDATPAEVVGWFRRVVEVSRRTRPEAPVFCLAITPTPKRWEVWDRIQEVNAALREACEADAQLHFIPTAMGFLGGDGKPREDRFREDKLHLNRLGYEVWSGILKSHLEAVLGP